jgi:RNA polymerase sigma-70 factor (ECF subfamily)
LVTARTDGPLVRPSFFLFGLPPAQRFTIRTAVTAVLIRYDLRAMPGPDPSATSTLLLLEQARHGDPQALNRLLQRYLPRLTRWASGRLPRWARDMSDTDDLVQETLVRSVSNLPRFQPQGDGALQAYLRTAVMNRIRDEVRRRGRQPEPAALDSAMPGNGQSPLEQAIGSELLGKYDRALDRLAPEDREAVIARIELGCSYSEIAEATGRPSADAARMAVSRALLRLAEEMRHAS